MATGTDKGGNDSNKDGNDKHGHRHEDDGLNSSHEDAVFSVNSHSNTLHGHRDEEIAVAALTIPFPS